MSETPYVCAFRGRRDDYQVPHALAEAGQLQLFITDAYANAVIRKIGHCLPEKMARKIAFRQTPGIPDHLVRSLWKTTLTERVRHRLGYSPTETYAKLDQEFSRQAANEARRSRANLYLYTPYAWEAFNARYAHTPRRVLFEYHPHAAAEGRILAEDVARFPEVLHSYTEATGSHLPDELRKRTADAWTMADSIVCASSFTKQTVVSAGADPSLITVIPYGVEQVPRAEVETSAATGPFKALFVGSGVQRKGLHHLLRAWKIARLDKESSLTLVCRNLDPGLEEMVVTSPRTRLLRGTSASDLSELFSTSSLFVMPSLVEGFGQVYLEALSFGCPVLGTANTCLPDLGGEDEGIFLTGIGQVEELADQIERLSQTEISGAELRRRAQLSSQQFTWKRFRSLIQHNL